MTEKSTFHSGERGGISPKKRRHSREKNPVIPAKAGIHSGRLILEFRKFYGKIKFGIPAHFFAKNEVNAGICR